MEGIFFQRFFLHSVNMINTDLNDKAIGLATVFTGDTLQPGLINAGLLCYLNSVVFFLHRVGFKFLLEDDLYGGGDYAISLMRYMLWLYYFLYEMV